MVQPSLHLLRSLLFCPANRGELLVKIARISADACVIDLEDGTPPGDKEAARKALDENVRRMRGAGVSGPIFVRINARGTPFYDDDLIAALSAPIDGIVLPKCEDMDAVRDIEHRAHARPDIRVVGGVETVRGVMNAEALCSSSEALVAVYFGSEDIAAEIGATRTEQGEEMLYARSKTLLAAKAAGILAIDQAVIAVRDDEAFRADARRGRRFGYDGKICLTLKQVELANELFAPSSDEVARCERLVASYDLAVLAGRGTFAFEGRMVDTPIVERARAILKLANRVRELERN